jgi:hypothetical protein
MVFTSTTRINKVLRSALQFDVHFTNWPPDPVKTFCSTKFPVAGFKVHLTRHIRPIIINVYFPSIILVVASWVSFLIPPELIPGRMALIITVLLMLLNLSVNNSNSSLTPMTDKESDLQQQIHLRVISFSSCIKSYNGAKATWRKSYISRLRHYIVFVNFSLAHTTGQLDVGLYILCHVCPL